MPYYELNFSFTVVLVILSIETKICKNCEDLFENKINENDKAYA